MSDSVLATRQKGPPVFLDYDQTELDACYDQSVWAPNMSIVHERSDRSCEIARQYLGEPQRLAYGSSPIEMLDLFRAPVENAPVIIYVHGGAWRTGTSRRCHAAAEVFVAEGIHYIALDFINVDEAGGSLFPMIEQVRRAIAWIYRNATSFGGNPDQLFVAGHSSGAHLTGNILTTDWPMLHNLPFSILKGGLVTSGMFELFPVSLSARSKYVSFTHQMVEELSSIRHIDRLHCPVVVTYGTCESPEFQRQSRDFAAAVDAAGKAVRLQVGIGYNHFEMAETFANPYGLVGRAALDLIKTVAK